MLLTFELFKNAKNFAPNAAIGGHVIAPNAVFGIVSIMKIPGVTGRVVMLVPVTSRYADGTPE